MNEIYTIGHSTFPIENLYSRLLRYSINCLIDVRSTPYSQYAPQYNSPDLKKFLNNKGIYYMHLGEEFGARQLDKALYTTDGYLDFEQFRKTIIFQCGVKRVISGMDKGYTISLMCTEKDPINCHRNILVAREFHMSNYIVKNIHWDGRLELQTSLEERLLDMYYPNREQASIFELLNGGMNELQLIESAYRLRNKDIGYKINKDTEGDCE